MGFQIHFANQRNDIYNFPPIRVRFFLFFKSFERTGAKVIRLELSSLVNAKWQ